MKRKPCSLGWTDHAFRRLERNNFRYGKWFFALRRKRKYKTLAARIAATLIPKEPF
jgi:hypothetical protein